MQPRGRVHLGVLEVGSRSPSRAAPQRGDWSWSRQSSSGRDRFEAALAVGPVELEGHRSPACADAARRRTRHRRARRRLPVARVERALVAALPEQHLLGQRDLAREQGADRFTAVDPLDGLADERRDRQRRDLAEALALGQRDRVGQHDLDAGWTPRSGRSPGRSGRRAWRRRRSR